MHTRSGSPPPRPPMRNHLTSTIIVYCQVTWLACSNHMTLYLYVCYQPYAFWHSGWVGPCPVQLTLGNEATSSPLCAGLPSSYDFGAAAPLVLGSEVWRLILPPLWPAPLTPVLAPSRDDATLTHMLTSIHCGEKK